MREVLTWRLADQPWKWDSKASWYVPFQGKYSGKVFFSLGSVQKDPAVPAVIGCIKPLKDDSGKDSRPQER